MLWFLCFQAFVLRCCRKTPVWPLWLWAISEDLFAIGLLGCLLAPLPVFVQKMALALYFCYQSIDQTLWNAVKIRLTPSVYSYFRDYRSFRSSFFAYQSACYLPSALLALCLTALSLWPFDNEWALAPFCLLCGISVWKQPIPCDHPGLIFVKKKRPLRQSMPPFFSSNQYPLLHQASEYKTPLRFSIRKSNEEKPHIIFLILESFRAKNVGALGAKPSLSPHFDALTAQGILFSRFYANGTLSSRALIASLMGIPAAQNPSYMSYYSKIPMRGLPQILKDEGYSSAFFWASFLSFQGIDLFLKNQGIDFLFDRACIAKQIPNAQSTSWGIYDEYTATASLDWLKNQTQPAFVTLFTTTNHHPWDLPSHWTKKYPKNPYADTFLYTDAVLGSWVERAKRENILERSLVFIFGDHGQSLGEHDANFSIHRTLFEEEIHVPLLLLAEGRINPGQRCDAVCSQIDLLPTVLDALGINGLHHSLGASLLRAENRSAYFNQPFDLPSIGCRKQQWKFLKQADDEKLFNLEEDPEEKIDVKGRFNSIHQELKTDTESFFTMLQSLYEHNAFFPRNPIAAVIEWKAPPEIENQTLVKALSHMPLLTSVDLSQCSHISGEGLNNLPAQIKKLNLSHTWRIDDNAVERIAQRLYQLCEIDLSYCPLITEHSLASLARDCPLIETLTLKGLDGIAPPTKPLASLVHLNLSQSNRSLPSNWADWIAKLGYLKILQLDCSGWNGDTVKRLNPIFSSLQQLELSQGDHLFDADVRSIFEASSQIGVMALDTFPHLTDEGLKFLRHSKIHRLMLSNCPRLSAQGILPLISSLPLQTLILKQCPAVLEKEFENRENKQLNIIFLRDCF